MEEHKFMELYTLLCAAYGKPFERKQALVYCQYLGGYDYERLKKAVDQAIRSPGQFMPTIGDLIDRIAPADVGRAWAKIVDVASGGCRSWRLLSDVEIAAVGAVGGMHMVQNADEEGLRFIFNDFKRQYPVQRSREIQYPDDLTRLKNMNMVHETYKFIAKSENLLLPDVVAPEVQKMLEQVGTRI